MYHIYHVGLPHCTNSCFRPGRNLMPPKLQKTTPELIEGGQAFGGVEEGKQYNSSQLASPPPLPWPASRTGPRGGAPPPAGPAGRWPPSRRPAGRRAPRRRSTGRRQATAPGWRWLMGGGCRPGVE